MRTFCSLFMAHSRESVLMANHFISSSLCQSGIFIYSFQPIKLGKIIIINWILPPLYRRDELESTVLKQDGVILFSFLPSADETRVPTPVFSLFAFLNDDDFSMNFDRCFIVILLPWILSTSFEQSSYMRP